MFVLNDDLGNPYSVVIDSSTGAWTVTPVQNVTPSSADNSITQTALSLISSSLRLINAVASGDPVPIDMANDALMVFNQMLDAWNADRLSIFTTSSADYALMANKQSYTLGIGGDWNTNWPAKIDSMSAVLLNNASNPVEEPILMLPVGEWQRIPVKNVSGTFPLLCYDDGNFPLRTLNMWPIPDSGINTVRIYSWQPLGLAATLTTQVHMPPGYAEAFRYNLAVRLSAEFAATITPVVQQIAIESLARLKSMNAPDLKLESDLAPAASGYRYRADMFGLPY